MREDMKLANVKRKRAMQMLETEKQNYERLLNVPEENKVRPSLMRLLKS